MPPNLLGGAQRNAIAIPGTGVGERSRPTYYNSARLTLYVSRKVVKYIGPETRIVHHRGEASIPQDGGRIRAMHDLPCYSDQASSIAVRPTRNENL